MKLYDSLTQEKKHISQKKVNIYSCGPTVYNYIHLGNARPLLLVDTLNRYLSFQGYQPYWVQNITDIDDKIINQALKTNQSEREIADKYFQAYLVDLKKLNVKMPQKIPLISNYLPEMINYIEAMIKLGFAYQVDGNVFFNVEKMKNNYGKLSNIKIEQLQGTTTKFKKSNLDFALWKKTNQGKKWNSPWGWGRPGWHTECVVLIDSNFKNQNLDIHAGGIDLQFPHHENERAQYFAVTGKELANTWLHNGHLTLKNEKMSKSQGNMILVKDFLKSYDPDLLRWIFLTTNYRQPLNFTEDLINQGLVFFKKNNNLRKKMIYYLQTTPQDQHLVIKKMSSRTKASFQKAMDDNLNTPQVLSLFENLLTETNKNLVKHQFDMAQQNYYDLVQLLKILGFKNHLKTHLSQENIKIYQQWLEALKNHDFQSADDYRHQLQMKDLV